MNEWKISSRLRLLIAVSIVVMLLLLGINWFSLNHLSALSTEADKRAGDSSSVNAQLGLGAQAYRIIADTYINRDFEAVDKGWRALSVEIDQALSLIARVVDTGQEVEWSKGAAAAINEVRSLYVSQYLPLAKGNASAEEIRAVDDKIDRLIDQYEEHLRKIDLSLKRESAEAAREFASGVTLTKLLNGVSIALGGALLILLGVVISRSITTQLGMELSAAMAAARSISQGDLTGTQLTRVATRSDSDDSLAASLLHMNQTLAGMVSGIRASSQTVATASAEIAHGNTDLAARTEEQASALEEASCAMEQLGASVKQNADNVNTANQLALDAARVATEGGSVVAQAVSTIRGINDASSRIADIIGVIDDIAFQTNILALNAAVEAARAGEQGRGFAVVANEVRSLAGRSAVAAKEIKTLIDGSVSRIAQGTALVDQAGRTMNDVVSSIQRVTLLMTDINVSTSQQASGIYQVGDAVAQMDQATQQNAALVEQSAAAAHGLREQAMALNEMVGRFKVA